MIFVYYPPNSIFMPSTPNHTMEQIKNVPNTDYFTKDYEDVIKKASEFPNFNIPASPVNYGSQSSFRKFSLYADLPNSTTSFNTDAVI